MNRRSLLSLIGLAPLAPIAAKAAIAEPKSDFVQVKRPASGYRGDRIIIDDPWAADSYVDAEKCREHFRASVANLGTVHAGVISSRSGDIKIDLDRGSFVLGRAGD